MQILDPDLWNDDGTPKRPTKKYMESLKEAQDLEAADPETPRKVAAEKAEAFISYARAKREALENTPATLGDVVHFWDGDRCRAAVVIETETFTDACTLQVFIPHEAAQCWVVDHNEDKVPESWHWAESE